MYGLTDEQARIGLGAMKNMAAVNGAFTEEERKLVQACAGALEIAVDVDALPIAGPEAAAAVFTDALWRKRLLQALMATAMVDGDATRDELALLQQYTQAFDVDEAWVKTLEHVVEGHLMRVRFDVIRRNPLARQTLGQIYAEEGICGVWKFIKAARQKGDLDPEVAWRFKQLGLLPDGTLGREYWAHMTRQKFAFPGEPTGLHLAGVHHDLTHVLTGYDTDPAGECQIAAFYAGYKGNDPFAFVFFTMVMFHLGIAVNPGVVTPATMQWDPEKVVRAMQRGAKITRDLTDHWDFWPDMALPIDDVRRKYNIA